MNWQFITVNPFINRQFMDHKANGPAWPDAYCWLWFWKLFFPSISPSLAKSILPIPLRLEAMPSSYAVCQGFSSYVSHWTADWKSSTSFPSGYPRSPWFQSTAFGQGRSGCFLTLSASFRNRLLSVSTVHFCLFRCA